MGDSGILGAFKGMPVHRPARPPSTACGPGPVPAAGPTRPCHTLTRGAAARPPAAAPASGPRAARHTAGGAGPAVAGQGLSAGVAVAGKRAEPAPPGRPPPARPLGRPVARPESDADADEGGSARLGARGCPRLPARAPPRPWLPVPLPRLLSAACRARRGALAAAEAERSRPASEPQPGGRELRPSHVPRRPFKQELRSRPGPRAHTAPPAARRTARSRPAAWCPGGRGGHAGGRPPSLAWAAAVDAVGRVRAPRRRSSRGPGRPPTLCRAAGFRNPSVPPRNRARETTGEMRDFSKLWELPLPPTSEGELDLKCV